MTTASIRVVWSILRRLPGLRRVLIFLVLAGVLQVPPALVIPVFTKIFVDQVLVAEAHHWLGPLVAGMVLVVGLRCLLTWFQQRCLLRLEHAAALVLGVRTAWCGLAGQGQVDLAGDLEGADKVAALVPGPLAVAVVHLPLAVAHLALMLVYDLGLGALALVVGLGHAGLLTLQARRRQQAAQALMESSGRLTASSVGILRGRDSLKAAAAEPAAFAEWTSAQARVLTAGQEQDVVLGRLAVVPVLLTALSSALVLGAGGLQVLRGELSLGTLVAILALLNGFLRPLTQTIEAVGTVIDTLPDWSALGRRLGEAPPEGMPGPGTSVSVPVHGHLEVDGVLQDATGPCCLEFAAGDLVMITGAGASELARILAGLAAPSTGTVRLDGRPLAAWDREARATALAHVGRDSCCLTGTVRENLTLWDDQIDEASLVAAARDALIHEVIAARPGGYEAPVAEGGRNFSGGQRQRLGLARALVTRPRVLILDGALSALDALTAATVETRLRRRGCTLVVVEARPAWRQRADRIVVVDHHRLIASGTHEDLIGSCPGYAAQVAAGL